MTSPPLDAEERALSQLPACITAIEHLLDAQPDFTTVMDHHLRQGLAALVPDSPPDPHAVFLNEYSYDPLSGDSPAGTLRVPRLTRTRNLTQVLHDAIVSQKIPTALEKEPENGLVDKAVGFYTLPYDTGRENEISALEVSAVNALIQDLQENSPMLYWLAVDGFWSSPHVSTGDLTVQEAIGEKQRQVFHLEADLKLHDARQEHLQAGQALQKHPEDKSLQTAAEQARTALKVMTEGRQLIENLVLHETSGSAPLAQVFSLCIHSKDEPEWSAALNGCFIITQQLHGPRPTVLYTPQFGIEVFEHFTAMANRLRQRLVADPEKTRLLSNVAIGQRGRASDLLSGEQNLRYTPIIGQVFSALLEGRRQQQDAEIDHAFSTSPANFETLARQLRATLALPFKGSPELIARLPERAEPVSIVVPGGTLPDVDQQTRLIKLWHDLNQQIGDVLDKQKHPSLENALDSLLKETFPQLPADTTSAGLYVNRYRTGEDGSRQFESSRPLLETLRASLLWENFELPDGDNEATPTAETDVVSEGVFSSPTACTEADQLRHEGSLAQLADALQARLLTQIRAYWQTPNAAQLQCPQARLLDLHRQALNVQACLRAADQTLSPQAKLLIDRALHYPTQARREAHFNHGTRPGVYRLAVENGTAEGARLAGSFVLTSNDGSSPSLPHWPYGHKNLSAQGLSGSSGAWLVVLYTPQQGFEEMSTLQAVRDTLIARINTGEEAGRLLASGLPLSVQHVKNGIWGDNLRTTFEPIEADFVADSIQALLNKQQSDIDTLLRLTEGERDGDSNARAELVELLDMAGAFMARNRLLLEHWRPDWEKRLSAADQQELQDRARTAQETQTVLSAQWKAQVPTLAEYARDQVLLKIRAYLAEKGPDDQPRAPYPVEGIDPDQTLVTRTTTTRVISGGGGFGSMHESVRPTYMSLTDLLLKNNKPWERSFSWKEDDLLQATLMTSQGRWLRDAQGKTVTLDKQCLERWVNELNIGHRYTQDVLVKTLAPDATASDAVALQKAWQANQAAALEYAAVFARLSPDAYSSALSKDNTQKTAAAWVAAILAAPDPKKRSAVDGQAVIANALLFNPASHAPDGRGGQTVNGVLVLSTAQSPQRVLYAPNAPDGIDLRELASEAELPRLLRQPAWRAYLQARLPAGTRLLNQRLVAHSGDVLAGLYRQNYLYLQDKTDAESVTNDELNAQSRLNQVMFGVEVVTAVLSAFPWGGQMASSALRWAGRVGRASVHTLRHLGQNVAGLIVRRTTAGRTVFGVATAINRESGVSRASGIVVKPLPLISTSAKPTSIANLTNHQRAFLEDNARLVVKGGIPDGSSLADGTGIYRTPSNTLLVRSTGANGEEQIFRIHNSFNLYDPNGLVAPVLTPGGAFTPFKLRRMPNQLWTLDTFNRLPGAGPKAESAVIKALREWNERITANAQSANPLATLDPFPFFNERNIPLMTWNKYVRPASGEINETGYALLRFEPSAKLTDEMFLTWVSMNQPTREAAQAFAASHRLHPVTWGSYVSRKGELTNRGLARVIRLQRKSLGTKIRITDQHLQAWHQLALKPENQNRRAVIKFALDNDIHTVTWGKYVKPNGEFNMTTPMVAERVNRLGLTQNRPQPGPSGSSA